MQALIEIEIATNMIKDNSGGVSIEHPLDTNYRSLSTDLCHITHPEELAWIASYIKNTHGPTHNTYKLDLHQVWCAGSGCIYVCGVWGGGGSGGVPRCSDVWVVGAAVRVFLRTPCRCLHNVQAFEVVRTGEAARFTSDMHNRRLLWYVGL